jgi:hypothetical protein
MAACSLAKYLLGIEGFRVIALALGFADTPTCGERQLAGLRKDRKWPAINGSMHRRSDEMTVEMNPLCVAFRLNGVGRRRANSFLIGTMTRRRTIL